MRIAGPFNRIAGSLAATLGAAWISCLSPIEAQTGCIITGGTNYGSIIQNCNFAPAPLTVLSKSFEKIKMPNGELRQQIFVQVGQPITLLLVACGDAVTDLGASPWPAGITFESEKMTKGNCVAHRYSNTAPGRWAMWVTLNKEDGQFTLQPVIEQ